MSKSRGLFHFLVVSGILAIFSPWSRAQPLEVSSAAFGGKVQVQRKGEQTWTPITKKTRLARGDNIRTGPKSFLILRVAPANQIVIGSNSQMLFDSKSVVGGSEMQNDISVTVVEGGVFFSWAGGGELTASTSDGSVSFQKGRAAMVFDSKDAATRVTAFMDSMAVEQLTSKKKVMLNMGQFSVLKPDENPTEAQPLDKTTSDILQQLFGERFLERLFKRFSISVSETKTKGAAPEAAKKKAPAHTEDTSVKPVSDTRKKTRTIQLIEGLGNSYQPPPLAPDRFDHKYLLEAGGTMLNTNPGGEVSTFLGMKLRCGMRMDDISVALNVPFASDNQGSFSLALSGIQGVLDKIYYADYRNTEWNFMIHAGQLDPLTFNKGALVRNFSNEIRSQIAQPLGVYAIYGPHPNLTGQAFIADLSSPTVMGANWQFDNGWAVLGVSAVFDLNQGKGLTFSDGENRDSSSRFRSLILPLPKPASKTRMVWGWDSHVEFNFIQDGNIYVFGYVNGMFLYTKGEGMIGAVFQAPGINILYQRISAFVEGVMTTDRAHPGYFNDFYPEDRSRIRSGRAFSQVERHPPMGISKGFRAGLHWQVGKQLWTGAEFGRNFGVVTSKDTTLSSSDEALLKLNIDQNALFKITGGENLIPGIKRFELWYNLQHGQLGRELAYPRNSYPDGIYSEFVNWKNERPFLSLNLSMGFSLEYSIMRILSIVARYRSYGFDFKGNAIYDPGDLVSEFGVVVRMKF